ncbi:MAG: hypothetical protein KIT82_05715 [Bradyrhizobium sp.]|nr:hypothetical protein [Bradyrhizobium sp.]
MDDFVGFLLYVVLSILGWPIRTLRRWLDRQPHRDPSQVSTLHKIGRLSFGIAITVAVLAPLDWLIFR